MRIRPASAAVVAAAALLAALGAAAALAAAPGRPIGEDAAGAGSASAEHALGRATLTLDGFTVHFPRDHARAAEQMLAVAATRGAAVAERAGLLELGPVSIHIAGTDDDFRTLTMGGAPDWGAGCAFPERGVIVLRSPLTVPDPLGMEDVIVHEVAHVAAGRVLGGVRVPRWFHEGVAMTLAGEWRLPRSSRMSGAGAGRGLIPLGELSQAFPADHQAAMVAYSESFYAVRFLMDEAALGGPGELLAAVAAASNFEAAMTGLYGAPLSEFERDATRSFERRFGWVALLTGWQALVTAMTLLLLLGGALRLRRARVRMREWEAEEERRLSAGRRVDPGHGAGWN